MCLLFFLLSQVVVPLLSADRNQSEWTQTLCEDVGCHVHNLKTNVFVVSGQVQGKTLLAPPAESGRVEQTAVDERWHLRHQAFTDVLLPTMTHAKSKGFVSSTSILPVVCGAWHCCPPQSERGQEHHPLTGGSSEWVGSSDSQSLRERLMWSCGRQKGHAWNGAGLLEQQVRTWTLVWLGMRIHLTGAMRLGSKLHVWESCQLTFYCY